MFLHLKKKDIFLEALTKTNDYLGYFFLKNYISDYDILKVLYVLIILLRVFCSFDFDC